MICCQTRWIDLNALAACGTLQNRTEGAPCWQPSAIKNPTHIECYGDSISVFFPITYFPGSIVKRFRVKYQGSNSSTGFDAHIYKRNEAGTTPSYTSIFSALSNVSASLVVLTLDPTDFTIEEGFSYLICINSKVPSGQHVKLYSFGIETTHRIY